MAPRLPPVVPPSRAPSKPLVTYQSLIEKPESLVDAGITEIGTKPIKGPLHLHNADVAVLTLERDEGTAADETFLIEFMRDGIRVADLGLDDEDRLTLYIKAVPDDDTDLNYVKAVTFDKDIAQTLNVDQPSPAVYPMLGFARQTDQQFFIGLDDHDRLAIIGPDQSTVLAYFDATGALVVADHVTALSYHDGSDTQVVGAQLGPIADAVPVSGSPGGGGSAGGSPGDPATLGDVDGAYSVANSAVGTADDALGTANAALTAVNLILDTLRTHGLIAT